MSKNQRRGLSSFDALGDMFNIPKINDSKQLGIVTEANSYTGEFKIKKCRDNCLHNYIETTEKKKSIKKDMSVIFEMDESNNSIKNPKFFNYSYCVPRETIFKLINDERDFANLIDNFALQLNKYAKLTMLNDKKSFAYSDTPDYLYRVVEKGSSVPAFGINPRTDIDMIFTKSLKPKGAN